MKIESISIQNFKLFENVKISFKNKTLEEVSNRFMVLGDNSTGKTTLLQAIALPLALATQQIQSLSDFDWLGFLPSRLWKWGTPRIQLEVSFEDEEIKATQEMARKWYTVQPAEFQSGYPFIEPGNSRLVQLTLNGDYWKAGRHRAEQLQFMGRYYAQKLLKIDSSVRSQFSKLPGIFWFDQYRNFFLTPPSEKGGNGCFDNRSGVFEKSGVALLRQYLIQWKHRQETGHSTNHLMALENLYSSIFPGRTFAGLEYEPSIESPTEEESYFVINDGHHTYDIVEMSAGEQAVLPILYEFIRQQIAYSVVLIDEIDLNLHPPVATSLVRLLPKMSPTSQFIFTTHSEAVNNVISEDNTHRLPGGSLCL